MFWIMNKKDFPIFENNPWIVYLDSAASTQKPAYVLEWVKRYLENDYANIHRWWYGLSQKSEDRYWKSRQKVAQWLHCSDDEVIFTANSTDSSNKLVQSLAYSWWINKDDAIILCSWDHHANIVPWQIASERVGFEIIWIDVDSDGYIDFAMLKELVESDRWEKIRCVSIGHVSNVLGVINDINQIRPIVWDDCLIVVDASQSIAHIRIDVKEIDCDFLWFTGHKLWALTWVWVLYGKKNHLASLKPSFWWWWSIEMVSKEWYSFLSAPDKFESWTPNLVWVVSLFLAFEYMEIVGQKFLDESRWKKDIQDSTTDQYLPSDESQNKILARYWCLNELESQLVSLCLDEFEALSSFWVKLHGSTVESKRIGVFSFSLPSWFSTNALAQFMAEKNICIRCWAQCSHLYHQQLWNQSTCRISLWLYNDIDDINKFFEVFRLFLSSR